MPTPIAARYHARDGTEHRVVVRRSPDGRWRVLDIAQTTTIIETIGGNGDGRAQADALARDYAAEQEAFHLRASREQRRLPRPGLSSQTEQPAPTLGDVAAQPAQLLELHFALLEKRHRAWTQLVQGRSQLS